MVGFLFSFFMDKFIAIISKNKENGSFRAYGNFNDNNNRNSVYYISVEKNADHRFALER